jgi:hypothetical protein
MSGGRRTCTEEMRRMTKEGQDKLWKELKYVPVHTIVCRCNKKEERRTEGRMYMEIKEEVKRKDKNVQ